MSFYKNIKNKEIVFYLASFVGIISLFLSSIFISKYTQDEKATNVVADSNLPLRIKSNIIGPFDENSSDTPLTLTLNSSVYYEKIRETFIYGIDEDNIGYSYSSAIHSLEPESNYYTAFTFPGKQIATYGSRYVRIVVKNESTKTNIFETSFTISRIARDELNANGHLGQYWYSNILGFKIENSKITYYGDALSVIDTIDFLAVDYYYRLDLSSIYFEFISRGKTYDNVEIYFEDEHNIFPYFSKDESGVIHLPLSIDMSAMPKMGIKYKNGFYVNPRNLDMSSTIKSGYRATNYFYFPVNKLEQVVDYKFTFEITGLGWNKTTFRLTLDYDVSQRLIGRCDTSEYCITGGITE